MNDCNRKFLARNGISIEDVCSKVDSHIYSRAEINPIIANFGFQTKESEKIISIADIVGYDREFYGSNPNIFLSMDYFFSKEGRSYNTRSLGMLEYNKDNILEQLKKSFDTEPISLIETGEGNYTVFNNGMHRYTLLRILYLSEVANANGNKNKLQELKEKYTVPAKVMGVDLEKTYCKYLLKKVTGKNDDWDINNVSTEYDSNYKITGNVIVTYSNGEREALSNEDLIGLTRDRVLEDEYFESYYPLLQQACTKYPSFRKFIEEKFLDIIPLQDKVLEQKGIDDND